MLIPVAVDPTSIPVPLLGRTPVQIPDTTRVFESYVFGAPAGYVCLVLGIALLVGSCRDWVKVVRVHVRQRDLASSDAFLLQGATRVPSPVWLASFALVIGTALAVSVGPLALIAGPALG